MEIINNKNIKKVIMPLIALINVTILSLCSITYSYADDYITSDKLIENYSSQLIYDWITEPWNNGFYVNALELTMSQNEYNNFINYEVSFNGNQTITRAKYPYQNGIVKINFLDYNNGMGILYRTPVKIWSVTNNGQKQLIFDGPVGSIPNSNRWILSSWNAQRYVDALEVAMTQGNYNNIIGFEVSINNAQPITRAKYPYENGIVKINILDYNNGMGLKYGVNSIIIRSVTHNGEKQLIYQGLVGH